MEKIRIKEWYGCLAIEENGKQYIDLTSGGIFAAGLGCDPIRLRDAIDRSPFICAYNSHYSNYWTEKYIKMLKELTGFESVALFSTGSEATEAFWRCCRVYYNKPGVWGGLVDPDEVGAEHPKCDAMHGMTLGAMIMAGKMSWHELGIYPELGETRFGTAPERTACMIIEPYHAPSAQFHKIEPTINRIVTRVNTYSDIPLGIDEVQGGFGRTGKLFAYEHYDGLLKPQFVMIGKLCGGGLPLSALLGPKEIMESETVNELGHLHSTHSGNPLICSVGCAVIEEMARLNLIAESARKGELLHDQLRKLQIRTHGKGLLAGIEFKDRAECEKAVRKCHERGILVVDTGRKWIKIGPALTIEEGVLMQGVKILSEVIEEVLYERNLETRGDSSQEPGGVRESLSSDGVQEDQPGTPGGNEDGGR